jgi:glycosyltransferase involved in cell wall biosynthesis
MRITFVLPPNSLAGGMRVIATYAGALARRGHEVLVVLVRRRGPSLKRRAWALVRCRRATPLPLREHYFSGLPHRELAHSGPVTDDDVPDADVVVATYWRTAWWVATLSPCKGAKAYFMQDYGMPGQPLEDLVPTWSLPLRLITISQWLADLIHQHVDKPVDLVPNAVDHGLFHAPPRGKQPKPTVGFVYMPVWTKGPDLCTEAVGKARAKLKNLGVVTFGRPPDARFPVPDWIEHVGRVREEQLREVYGSCDTWLFGSRLEGFGLPILEAMACRTPVIATRAGAAPELLRNGGGVLVRPMHPDAMAAAIIRVCTLSDAAWHEMSDAAYRTATSYSWDDATNLFEQALQRAADRRQAAGVSVRRKATG